MLNITNGDGAATILMSSSVEGDVLPWRDPMHHGPFPEALDLDQVSNVRARYLAGPDIDHANIIRDFQLRNNHLRAVNEYSHVVLWFEHDLLDQLQLLQLLDWFADAELLDTCLDMICIDRFDGVTPFRGIGQLSAEQMATLSNQAHPVTREQLDLATAGWSAFRSPDPRDLISFMSVDTGGLPFLHTALARHLEEYPSMQSGLTRSETQILKLVSDGVSAPGAIFLSNMELENAMFIGDWPTFSIIESLCTCLQPLMHCDPDDKFRFRSYSGVPNETIHGQRLSLTEAGESVRVGKRDTFGHIERDQWLGGVHLRSNVPMWTWDASSQSLTLREP